MKKHAMSALNAGVVLAALLLLWQILIWVFHIPNYMLPRPWAVARSVGARYDSLLKAVWITGEAAVGGLLGSIVVGIVISLVFAQSRWVRRMFYPYTVLLQTVPILAVAPLLIMWIGPGLLAVTGIAFILCLPAIIANTTLGLISVDRNLIDLFAMHNASTAQVLWKLRLPNSMPSLFAGIRIASGAAVIGAIIGELFAGSNRVGEGGLGYSIQYASSQVETDYLFALVLATAMLGILFFFIAMFLEWYFLHHWHESARPVENE